FVLDPVDEHATATQLGGLTLRELATFLEQGESDFRSKSRAAATVDAWALMSRKQWHACVESAGSEAPRMARTEAFSRIVLAGIICVNQERVANPEVERLAAEAIALPATLRDHRFQLYQ